MLVYPCWKESPGVGRKILFLGTAGNPCPNAPIYILQLDLPSSTCPTQVGGSWSFSKNHERLYTCMIQGHFHCSKPFGNSCMGRVFKAYLWSLKLPANCSQYSILIFGFWLQRVIPHLIYKVGYKWCSTVCKYQIYP